MMSKPIVCKKCGKLNKSDAPICWHCGEDIQPKQTPKEAIHSEIKFRHEVQHKRRVRNFWIFTFILLITTFGFILVNSIYGVFRNVNEYMYTSEVMIERVDDKTVIQVQIQSIPLNQTKLTISSIVLSNDDLELEIKGSKSNPWDWAYDNGFYVAILEISTPIEELEIYDKATIKFSFIVFTSEIVIPEENLYFKE